MLRCNYGNRTQIKILNCLSQKNKKNPRKVRVQRENSWQKESLCFYSVSLGQLFRKTKAVKGSRLQQWCYNGWWLIEMAAVNCIMSVRWWDHDHGKETRQGLIFHSGEFITSSHIIYCSSKIPPLTSQLLAIERERERGGGQICMYVDVCGLEYFKTIS